MAIGTRRATHGPNREAIPVESRGLRRLAATPGHATKRPRPRRGRRGNVHDVRRRVDVACERVGLIPRKRLRRWPRWAFCPGVSARRRHPRLSTNTPSAWRTRRRTHGPNREAIPVDSRGLRRLAATPGHGDKRPRPRRGRRGNGHDVRRRVDVACERVGPIPRKRLRRWAGCSLRTGGSGGAPQPRATFGHAFSVKNVRVRESTTPRTRAAAAAVRTVRC